MSQIRNRFDINNQLEEERKFLNKQLPNYFLNYDEIGALKGISLSILAHIIFIASMLVLSAIFGLVFPNLKKPELPSRDIEFKLVQNESKPPINKKTKIRSDRDSRAGGIHDPKRPVSEPSVKHNAPQKKSIQQPKQLPSKPAQKQPPQQTVKKLLKPVQQKPAVATKAPTPAPAKAPSAVKPTIKPAAAPQGIAKPTAPKLATAPKSPFNVAVPATKSPVGSTYKPQGQPDSSGESTGSSKGAPAPKFSSSGGNTGSQSGSNGSYTARGSSGSPGVGGNPSPGNPKGAPGIDAIRQPDWGPYMRDLERMIKRNWAPPKGDTSKRVVITFTIGRDGRLLSHKVTKSSGVPLADRAAMSAIELSAPFRPLPPEFKGQSVPVEFTFDYNVLNSVIK